MLQVYMHNDIFKSAESYIHFHTYCIPSTLLKLYLIMLNMKYIGFIGMLYRAIRRRLVGGQIY